MDASYVLCLQAEIEKSLPSASPVAALQGHPVVADLRRFLSSVEGIKTARDKLESDLKTATSDDMGTMIHVTR